MKTNIVLGPRAPMPFDKTAFHLQRVRDAVIKSWKGSDISRDLKFKFSQEMIFDFDHLFSLH